MNDLINNIEINIAPNVWDTDYVENIIGASMEMGVGTLSLSTHHLPLLEEFEDLPDIYINIGGLNSPTDSVCVAHDAQYYLERYGHLPQIKGINFPLIRERLIYGNVNQTFMEDCERMVDVVKKNDKLGRLRIDMQSLLSDTDLISICSETDLLGFAQLIIVSSADIVDVGLSVIKAKKHISTPTGIYGKFPSIQSCEQIINMRNKSIIMSPTNLFKLFADDGV